VRWRSTTHKLKGNQKERRPVRPYHVGQLDHGWYLIGHDVDRDDIRMFALQRISALEVQGERFERPASFKASDYLSSGFGVWGYSRGTRSA